MRGDRMGVGDVGAVQGGLWGSGDTACGDDGRGTIRQRYYGILDGHWKGERDEGIQQGGDRVGISDGTRVWLWGCLVHGDCAVRTDGMQGDRVGVGDIGAVHGGAWGSRDETHCVDSWRAIREHERGMVSGRWLGQRDASEKPCGVGIGICDGARVEPWGCGFHGDGAVRADGMRGDRVGVRDISAV